MSDEELPTVPGKQVKGRGIDLPDNRSVALYVDGESFYWVFTNNDATTKIRLSREALEAMAELLIGTYPDGVVA